MAKFSGTVYIATKKKINSIADLSGKSKFVTNTVFAYFMSNRADAAKYGNYIYSVDLKLSNMYDIDKQGKKTAEDIKSEGYDGFKFSQRGAVQYGVFDPKSATIGKLDTDIKESVDSFTAALMEVRNWE